MIMPGIDPPKRSFLDCLGKASEFYTLGILKPKEIRSYLDNSTRCRIWRDFCAYHNQSGYIDCEYISKMVFLKTRIAKMPSLTREASVTFLAGVILMLLLLPGQSNASYILDEPILGGHLFVVETGPVLATFLGSDAGYFNRLFLEGSNNGLREIFNKSSVIGTEVNLGNFLAGTELVFRLHVDNTGLDFYSGEGINNPDGLPHLLATSTFVTESGLYFTELGFEDLYGGGDKDYNDFSLSLSNVVDPPDNIPEPLTITLIGLGLAGIGYKRRQLKKA